MVQQGEEGEDGGGGEGGGAGEQAWRGGVQGVARGSQGAAAAHPGAVEAAGAHAGAQGARARRRAAGSRGAHRPGPSASAACNAIIISTLLLTDIIQFVAMDVRTCADCTRSVLQDRTDRTGNGNA